MFDMKFTIEDVCKELAKKLTANGEKLNLSERSIREQAETLTALLANDEMEIADFVEKVLPLMKTANNNIRNDVSAGIKEYKEKNQPTTTQPKQTQEPVKVVKEPSELEKRLAELEKRLAAADKRTLIENRKNEIISKMKEKGIKDVSWIGTLLDEVNLDGDDFDASAKAEKYIAMFNKKEANVNSDITPNSANGSKDAEKRIKDKIKAAKALAESQRLLD
ncbi:MAG: hypothetical protein ACI4TK_19800 [Agathobacter sp.]